MPIFDSYHRVDNGRAANCCISRIIRRILCITTLPSSPFGRFKEEMRDPSATPGLMARLMGLESVPPVDVRRKSRSQKARKKIIPMYHEFEDENFFILSFDRPGRNVDYPVVERWKASPRSAKERAGNRKRRRRRRRHSNKENLDADSTVSDVRMRKTSNVRRNMKDSSLDSNGARKVKEHLAVLKLKTEANSENSSPNSVLDCLEFPPDHKESSNSGHEESRLGSSRSRRTLSDELESLKEKERRLMNDCNDHEEEKQTRPKNCDPNCPEKWGDVSKMAALDVFNSSWFDSGMSKNYHMEEIGKHLASGILDRLLIEMLIELRS